RARGSIIRQKYTSFFGRSGRMGSWTVTSNSSRQTMALGRHLASWVQGGDIIGLVGELGTGKTCFVRGFCAGIEVGAEAWVRSPTFTLINEYQGPLAVYHIDLYRVGKQEDLETLNLREYLYGDGVSLIEWFEYLPAAELGSISRCASPTAAARSAS